MAAAIRSFAVTTAVTCYVSECLFSLKNVYTYFSSIDSRCCRPTRGPRKFWPDCKEANILISLCLKRVFKFKFVLCVCCLCGSGCGHAGELSALSDPGDRIRHGTGRAGVAVRGQVGENAPDSRRRRPVVPNRLRSVRRRRPRPPTDLQERRRNARLEVVHQVAVH